MVDRPTKRQPVAIAVIEAGTTIRLVSGNHDHGIATSASWYEKRNLAGPLAGGCSKLPASSTAPSKRMRWSETRLTTVCVSASNVHQPIRSSMTSLNFASTHLPTNNTPPAAARYAQGRVRVLSRTTRLDRCVYALLCSCLFRKFRIAPARSTLGERPLDEWWRLWGALKIRRRAHHPGGSLSRCYSPPAPRAPSSSSRGRSSRQWHLMRPTRPRRRGPGSSSSALSGLPRFVPLLWQPVWFSLGGGGSLPPAGYLSFPALVAVLCWLWLR